MLLLCLWLAASLPAATNIRVLLHQGSSATVGGGSLVLVAGSQKWGPAEQLGLEVFSDSQLRANGQVLSCPVKVRSENHLVLAGRPYRGVFWIHCRGGQLLVVNHLDLESYLKGIMKTEISPAWPEEAIKAQAVASRTFALFRMQEGRDGLYDVKATVADQVYGGVRGEDPRSNAAVDATKGEVLTYGGRLILSVFHSEAGGHTEDARDVWGGAYPYLAARKMPFETDSPRKEWTLTLTTGQISQALTRCGVISAPLVTMQVESRTRSGRAGEVRLLTEGGERWTTGHKLRMCLGPDKVRSALFDLQHQMPTVTAKAAAAPAEIVMVDGEGNVWTGPREDVIAAGNGDYGRVNTLVEGGHEHGVITFSGKGWGHGVGMSQWDAKTMAQRGWTYRQILDFFFPQTQLVRLP